MTSDITKTLAVLGLLILVPLAVFIGAVHFLRGTERDCWKQEATEAFQKYGSFKTRAEILKLIETQNDLNSKDTTSNPLEIIEKDPNGCSFGSNGQTVLRFTFNDKNELTKIQVFSNYIASNYKMKQIEERGY